MILLALLLAVEVTNVHSTPVLATKVSWFTCLTSLPDTTSPSFIVARERLMSWLENGCVSNTWSRVSDPAGVELMPDIDFKVGFQASDLTVSTFTNFWRHSQQGGVFINERGNRAYCPMIITGLDGKITLHQLRYAVAGGVLANSATFNGLDYSPTRLGLITGQSGNLFAPDHVMITNGIGSQLVDAIVFIGARAAYSITNTGQVSAVMDIVTQTNTLGGFNLTFEYEYLSSDNVPLSRRIENAWIGTNTFSGIRWLRGPQSDQNLFFTCIPDNTVWQVLSSVKVVSGSWNPFLTNVLSGQLWSVMPTTSEPRRFYWLTQPPL